MPDSPAATNRTRRRQRMDLALNAAVRCIDGDGGRLTAIIINPLTRIVTDVIVRGPGRLGAERLVPVEMVTAATPLTVPLRLSRKELARMQRFIVHEFVPIPSEYPSDNPGTTYYWPYTVPPGAAMDVAHLSIPPDELAVRRGDRV